MCVCHFVCLRVCTCTHTQKLIDLDKELTESSSGVLYEALRVAQQVFQCIH